MKEKIQKNLAGFFFLFCFFSCFPTRAKPEKDNQKKIALKPLEPIGFPKTKVDATDRILHNVFGSIPGVSLISFKEVKKFVASGKGRHLLQCGTEEDCMSDFGKRLNADLVIAGDVTSVGKGYALFLKLYDLEKKKVVRSLSGVITGEKSQHKDTLLELGYRLIAPHKHRGNLVVKVDVKKAKIYVNGEMKATSPAPTLSLKAGTHNIRVTHPSYHDFLKFIDLPFGQTIRIKANLTAYPIVSGSMKAKHLQKTKKEDGREVNYRPLPWYKKWYIGAAIGVGAALLAGTATAVGIVLSKDPYLKRDITVTLDR